MRACSAGNSSSQSGSNRSSASRTSAFGESLDLLPRCPPRANNNFRAEQENSELIDDGSFDLGRRQAADLSGLGTALQDRLADIVAVELAAFPGVGGRHGAARRSEDQALEQGGRLRPG